MKTIYFKNGNTLEITEEFYQDICEAITSGSQFLQKISLGIVINLYDISFIN